MRRTCSFSLWKVPVKNLPRGLILNKKKVYVGRAGTTFINRERKENLKRRTGTAFLSESGADKTNTVYEKGNTHIAKKSFDAVYQQQILRMKMKQIISFVLEIALLYSYHSKIKILIRSKTIERPNFYLFMNIFFDVVAKFVL